MLTAIAALVAIGLAGIYSTDQSGQFFRKQYVWLAIGIISMAMVNLMPYHILGRYSFLMYLGSLLLLGALLVGKFLQIRSVVPLVGGAHRWISLEALNIPFRMQPAEITKLTFILAMAWYLRHRDSYRTARGLTGPMALTAIPMILILLQPDMGTTLLFLPVLFSMLFVAGARAKHLVIIMLAAVLVSPVMMLVMKDYQQERVMVLLKQNSSDPYWLRGPGYQLHQSKICIGSGQLTGRSAEKHPAVPYRFLPHRHNDFIFALIANKWGFIGAVGVLVLFGITIAGGIEIAARQTDPFGRLVAVGIATLLAVQAFINIGVTVGIMPVTGMTLPFVSYGGSSLVANFLALGLLLNVARHRRPRIGPRSFEFDG